MVKIRTYIINQMELGWDVRKRLKVPQKRLPPSPSRTTTAFRIRTMRSVRRSCRERRGEDWRHFGKSRKRARKMVKIILIEVNENIDYNKLLENIIFI